MRIVVKKKLCDFKYRRNSEPIKTNKTVKIFKVVSKWKTLNTAEKCSQFKEFQLDSERSTIFQG